MTTHLTQQERLSRQQMLDAWLELDADTFAMLVASANGLLQYRALQASDPAPDLKALDATLLYIRTQGVVI